MSEKKSSSVGPFNITSLLALLTCLGGLLIASRRVSSDRPSGGSVTAFPAIGEQTEAGRLWKDPLDWTVAPTPRSGADAFAWLGAQADWRAEAAGQPMLLAVFLRSGPYSEDRESRIRSRFAVVSALGEAGYAPEDQDRVGAVEFAWPTSAELRQGWLTNDSSQLRVASAGTNVGLHQRAAFEWYRDRVFRPDSGTAREKRVLVLWLEEEQFADAPAARLGLLLNELSGLDRNPHAELTNRFSRVALIGPRSSATLRGLLPDFGSTDFAATSLGTNLQARIAAVLHHVDVFSPTASAMDAALVAVDNGGSQRQPVERMLTNFWFRSFHNFCATDAQLAGEALKELKLRKIDLADTSKNLVLISEWDTFYGRMLSLTYAVELARMQYHPTNHQQFNELKFVRDYRSGKATFPTNLLCYVYLRGLDGQNTKSSSAAPPADSPPAVTLETLKRGDTEENVPEGEAQLDYLTRLGDRLQELERSLDRQGRGRLDAVGIVGSDVYDTLVILQALRARFPSAVFFTTDLDARYLHPREQEWSRNLIVVSGYGLRLKDELQRGVPPFRDSAQTAQFAATLAALGQPELQAPVEPAPRRYEIGRKTAYDLSLTDAGPHPAPRALDRGGRWPRLTVLGAVLTVVGGGFLLVIFWRGLQHLTWNAGQFETQCLWFRREDVGGQEGVGILLARLRASPKDPQAAALLTAYQDQQTEMHHIWEKAAHDETQLFLDFVNQFMMEQSLPDPSAAAQSARSGGAGKSRLWRRRLGFPEVQSAARVRRCRRALSGLFTRLLTASDDSDQQALAQAAESARQAAEEEYWLRHNQRRVLSLAVLAGLILLGGLGGSAVYDHWFNVHGEPFSLLGGVSVWPTQFLRLLAATLAAIFMINSYATLHAGVFDSTRRFRLPFEPEDWQSKPWRQLLREFAGDLLQAVSGLFKHPSSLPRSVLQLANRWQLPPLKPLAAVKAGALWREYQQLGQLGARVRRTLLPFAVYCLFCIGVALLGGGAPYRPVRGGLANVWDLVLLALSVAAYLFLAFWTIDAARLCRWLIEHLSQAPTKYPKSCLQFFARQRGLENPRDEDLPMLAEWIDVQLIAELTERVGRLVYYPFIVFFLLLLSRNNWWARWPWPPSLVVIFGANLLLALASMLILQRAAIKARNAGLIQLRAFVAAAERKSETPPPAGREADVGRRLIEEVESLQRGAYAPFWHNPVLGALLIPSSGSVVVELLAYLFH